MTRRGVIWIALVFAACASERPALRPDSPIEAIERVTDSAQRPLTAARAVQIALTGHPEVRAELARLDGIDADRMQAGLLRNPMLESMVLRPESGGRLAIEVGWMQTLFDLFTHSLRIAHADARARQAQAEVLDRLLEFGYAVETSFFDAVVASAQVRFLESELALDQETLDLQTRWIERGLASHSVLLELQAQCDQRRHRLHEAKVQAARARSVLAERMGLTSAEPLALPDQIELADVQTLALAVAQSLASTNRPELAASRAAIEAIESERAIESNAWRQLQPELGLRIERDANGMAMFGPELRIALPWFDWGRARGARLDARIREAKARDEALRRRVVLEVERALTVLVHAARASEAADHHLARAVQAKDWTERLYRQGIRDRMSYIQARRAVVEAERHRLVARAALAKAQIELQRALGEGIGG